MPLTSPEIAHPALFRIGLAGQRHLGIETVAMHAPVRSQRRIFQIMRGVEAELLGDLDFGLVHGAGLRTHLPLSSRAYGIPISLWVCRLSRHCGWARQ